MGKQENSHKKNMKTKRPCELGTDIAYEKKVKNNYSVNKSVQDAQREYEEKLKMPKPAENRKPGLLENNKPEDTLSRGHGQISNKGQDSGESKKVIKQDNTRTDGNMHTDGNSRKSVSATHKQAGHASLGRYVPDSAGQATKHDLPHFSRNGDSFKDCQHVSNGKSLHFNQNILDAQKIYERTIRNQKNGNSSQQEYTNAGYHGIHIAAPLSKRNGNSGENQEIGNNRVNLFEHSADRRDLENPKATQQRKKIVQNSNSQDAHQQYAIFMYSKGTGNSAIRETVRNGKTPEDSMRVIEVRTARNADEPEGMLIGQNVVHIQKSPKNETGAGNDAASDTLRMISSENTDVPAEVESVHLVHDALGSTGSESASSPVKLDLTRLYSKGTGTFRVAKLERLLVKASTVYLISTATYGSDVHRGAETARDVYGTTAEMVVDNMRMQLASSLKKDMSRNLGAYHSLLVKTGGEAMFLKYGINGRVTDIKDLQKIQRGINVILKKEYGVIIKGTGLGGWRNASKFLKLNEGEIPAELSSLIKSVYKDAMGVQAFQENGRVGRLRAMTRMGARRIARYLRQTEAGYGAFFTFNLVTRARSLLRGALFTVRSLGRAGYRSTMIAGKGIAWGAGKAAKHIPQPAKQMIKNNHVFQTASKGTKKVTDTGRKVNRNVHRTADRFRKFRKDPFRVKARLSGLGQKASHAALDRLNKTWLNKPIKVGGNVLKVGGKALRIPNMISSALARAIAAVASVVSTLISFLLVGVLLILAVILLLGFIINIFTAILGAFDFTAHEEEVVQAALEQIKTCYEQQIDDIEAMRGAYRNMNVTYREVRDDGEYQEREISVAETTNSAEMLSMATVYFDFDLEKAGPNKVKDYIRKLYNGSHQTDIAERVYNLVDEDGEPYTVKDADITITTYYFNGLFDCQLTDSLGTLSGTERSEQVWNYFRSAGFSEESTAAIMANLYAESGLDPSSIQGDGVGPAAGIAQWENYNTQSGRWKSMSDYCASQGKPWTDLKCQLDYILIEMPNVFSTYTGHGTYTYPNGEVTWWPDPVTVDQFKAMTDMDTAVQIFERTFERASIPHMQTRISNAHSFYNMYHGMEASSPEMQARVDRAMAQLGKPYEWGGVGPDSFDCSGLVGYAITGRYERRWTTEDMADWERTSSPEPGDICVTRTHAGVYIGNNQMIHAPTEGQNVEISTVQDGMWFVKAPS